MVHVGFAMTVTSKLQEDELPHSSVAVHVTVVVPTGYGGLGLQTMVEPLPEQLSIDVTPKSGTG